MGNREALTEMIRCWDQESDDDYEVLAAAFLDWVAQRNTSLDEVRPGNSKYAACVADRFGWVIDTEEALSHLSEHEADGEGCEECPETVVVVQRTALPSDEGRLPGSWATADMLVEHDDLQSSEIYEAVTRIKQAVRIVKALNDDDAAADV